MAQPAPLLATVHSGYGLFQYERAFCRRAVMARLRAAGKRRDQLAAYLPPTEE